MKKIILLNCIVLVSLFLPPSVLHATHIMGGTISYKYLGRDPANPKKINYKFTMRVYRDSTSTSQLDVNATVGIFMTLATGVYPPNPSTPLIRKNIPILSRRFLPNPTLPCLAAPPNIRVEEGLYEWTETLTDTNRTYSVTYMRCCRNETINNINRPLNMSSVYYVEITPEAQRTNNSSPDFRTYPPNLICANSDFNYDHSAVDDDGDQLVYRFCNGYGGGILANGNTTQNLSAPPFFLLTYLSPTYSFVNPIPSNPAIRLDPNTGIITGTPNVAGQFVATVCVEEYRNGALMSRIFRDYQYNVVACQRLVVSALAADSTVGKKFFVRGCENITQTFQNRSYDRANINSFKWEFKIGNDTVVYTDWSPTVTFRDTGVYRGYLILNPGQHPCSDTAFITVNVGGKVYPDFSFKYDTCVAGPVAFKNLTTSAVDLRQWVWDYGDNSLDTNKLEPSHEYLTAGIKSVKLSAVDKYGCRGDTTQSFEWRPAPPILIVEPDNFTGCAPAKVTFKNRSTPVDSTYKIVWDFGDGTTSNEYSPAHFYAKPDTYTVKLYIRSPLNCYKEAIFRSWIKVKSLPKADFDWTPKTINNLNPSVNFFDKSSADVVAWRWYFSNKAYSALKNPAFIYRDTGVQNIQLYVRNGNGCQDSIFKNLRIEPEVTFFMPTAFTPNDDSVNDVFKGTGFLYGLKSFRLTVWNRWGEVIFNTNDPAHGWNGLKNNVGQPTPAGVYLFEVEYLTPKNERKLKRDYLTLYR